MNKLNLKSIGLWSIRLKSTVIISTIFLIGIVGYFFLLRSAIEKKEKIYLAFQAYKKELNSQLEISTDYSNYQKRIKKRKNKFDIYSQQLDFWQVPRPSSNLGICNNHENYESNGNTAKNLSAKNMHFNGAIDKVILNVLSGQLSSPFFKINKIDILSTRKKNFLNCLQVESDFSGINNNIFNFLYQVFKLNRFILIEKFRWNFFNRLPETKKQNIIFLFKIYMLHINSKNTMLALSKINKLSAKSTSEYKDLIKYPLDKIKMLGFLSTGKNLDLGFVALPNKQIFKVQLGDQLGLERGLVIGIYDRQIFILNGNLKKIIKLSMDKREFSYVKKFA
jgi:Tfp pilus assembly protein PilO